VRFARVTLDAPARLLDELTAFYGELLGLPVVERSDAGVAVQVGETRLELRSGAGEPFYHVALLVPGDRWEPALEWAVRTVELLPAVGTSDVVFDFAFWDAHAVYFHDPAGSIVELIAHAGLDERGAGGPFGGAELVGVSEVGLVGDPAELAAKLRDELGLELWDGDVDGPGALGFVGEKGRTLILAPPSRGWLPTGRPAMAYPVDVVLEGARAGGRLEIGPYALREA
jgi:catechol 2,3-dioxygenase-like lactoylglutathione lyase family enzyme